MISFKCSQCGHKFSAPDDYAGKKARCKNCEQVNVIPAPEKEPQHSCDDSVAAYNNLLQELLKYEKQAPVIEI